MKAKAWIVAGLIGAIAPPQLPTVAQSTPLIVSSSIVAQTRTLEQTKKSQQDVQNLINQGKYREAVPLADRTLETFKTYFPTHKKEISISLRHRAFLYEWQGEDKKAERFYWDALNVMDVLGTRTLTQTTSTSSSGNEDVQNLIEPPAFKQRLDQKEFSNFWNYETTTSKKFADGKVINQEIARVIGLPKDKEAIVLTLLMQLGTFYYGRGKYNISESLFLASLFHLKNTDLIDKNGMRVELPGRRNQIYSHLTRLALRLNKIEELRRIDLPKYIDERFSGFLVFKNLPEVLKDSSPNLGQGYIANINARTLAPFFDIVDSTVFFATQSERNGLNAADKAFVNQLALSSIFSVKGRDLDVNVEGFTNCYQKEETHKLCNELRGVVNQLSSFVYKPQRDINEYKKLEEQRRTLDSRIRLSSFTKVASSADLVKGQPRQRVEWLKSVQAKVPSSAALIEIIRYRPLKAQPKFGDWWEDEHYAAAVLHPIGEPRWVDLGRADIIDAAVSRLRITLADGKSAQNHDVANVQKASRLLDQQVMAKIRPLLGKAEHLLISADGELNLVPFEALRDETGQYLIHHYQFSYLTSGRDLLGIAEFHRNPQKPQQEAVILADPDYYQSGTQVAKSPPGSQLSSNDNTASVDSLGNFDRAPGTAELAQTLKAEILPTAKLLTQTAATKTALQKFQSPQILVLATHGFFLPNQEKVLNDLDRQTQLIGTGSNQTLQSQSLKIENPLLRAGLALAGSNRRNDSNLPLDADNGILTALEIAGLDLRGTQLVVLSACETGVGEAAVGDGVYGLRRALAIAGAQSQVLSLWKVDDTATKDLMVNYFRKMVNQGQGRHTALQAAKLEMLKDPQRQHPYYWAGFIPSGDWTPLSK